MIAVCIPLTHTKDHIKKYLEAVTDPFLTIKETVYSGDLAPKLIRKSAYTGFLRLN